VLILNNFEAKIVLTNNFQLKTKHINFFLQKLLENISL